MAQSLLEADEETDVGVYGAYLRAQSDPDLLDIALHLDSDTYPARQDAAWREVRRRHLLHAPRYTVQEYLVRRLCVFALLLATMTLTLALILTPAEASGPAWPDLDVVPDGTPFSVILQLYSVAVLRALVYRCAWLGVYPLAWGGLLLWICFRAARRRQARADVWRLALAAFCVLTASVAFALSPWSAVSSIFSSPP